MGDKSAIEWTDATWNPVVGCSIVSPGCIHCYAMKEARRLARLGIGKYAGLTSEVNGNVVWNGTVRLHEPHLDQPLRWRSPRRIFVNSMSDLFHEDLPITVIAKVFAVMGLARQHTFQVLTKRSERLRDTIADDRFADLVDYEMNEIAPAHWCARELEDVGGWPLPNVWAGASVEDRARKRRIGELRETPAAVRFLSLEPLLEDLGELDLTGIHWVIAGGESGGDARPMHPDWVRSVRDQCAAAGVPFFFKQWGAWVSEDHEAADRHAGCGGKAIDTILDNPVYYRVGKRRAGRQLDGREHSEFPTSAAAT